MKNYFFAFVWSILVLCSCGSNARKSTITAEKAYQGVSNYCHSEYDWSVAEDNPDIMGLEMGEETEGAYHVVFRSYTGALVHFYVDKASGSTRMVESVPALGVENEIGTINLFDYLDPRDLAGRWAEKSAERIAAVFTPTENGYYVHIGWHEPGLAQYETWEMTAVPSRSGKLVYKDGIHNYLSFEHEGDAEYVVETDYTDGAGTFSLNKDGELVWNDRKDGSKTVFFRTDTKVDGAAAPELFPRVLQLCRYIPDHQLLPEAADYMTEDLYQAFADAFDAPAAEDGTIDDREWLYNLVTGNGGSLPFYSVASVVRTAPAEALATISVQDLWEEGGEPSGEPRRHQMNLILQDGHWLIADFDNCKQKL